MRYWYDTEFLDTGNQVHLISIGITAEDGRELHLINSEAPWSLIVENPWLMANVVPYLDMIPEAWRMREDMREEVIEFLKSPVHSGDTELWAWYGAYDHVLLMQLVAPSGKFIDCPKHIPHWTNDIRQKQHEMGDIVLPPQTNGQHNALEDARHNMFLHRYLESL